MKIVFLTRSLDRGGAERQLVELAKGLHRRGHQVSVGVFYKNGAFFPELHDFGINVKVLEKTGRWDVFGFLIRLVSWMRDEQPDILHGYLSLPNVLTVLLRLLVPGSRSVWGVRSAYKDLRQYDWVTRLSYRMEQTLARLPDLIIVNSHAGKDYANQKGFPGRKMIVIPNGIDCERFRPNPQNRLRLRREWGIRENEFLIGLVGRLDPIKDHSTFLQAAALLSKSRSDVRFVCIGQGPSTYQTELQRHCETLDITSRVIWAGLQKDMPSVYNALDILVSSSIGEGFPNVIGEAMACGLPCVVTDVGDSAWITGELGFVVPPSQPERLAEGMQRALAALEDQENSTYPRRIRQRILDNFSTDRLVSLSEQALSELRKCV